MKNTAAPWHSLLKWLNHDPLFTKEKTEAQRGDVTCSKPQGHLGPILQIQSPQPRASSSCLVLNSYDLGYYL